MRISKKTPFGWFLLNFGNGGVENYNEESMCKILKAVKTIFENAGSVELEWLGKFFVKLSNEPELIKKFLDEIKGYGF